MTTLLGVDDSKTMRKVLEITFAGEDFRTILAENADDAMSKLSAERPSIVLLDAGLDGTNGYDLCQRVKAAAPGTGVILLASKQQPYDRARGSQVGADDFIDKPFDTQQLIDKVGALLRKGASGPSVQPVAPVVAPSVGFSARPGEVAARPRTQTLAYGAQMTPIGQVGPTPIAPVVPPPVSAAAAPAMIASAVAARPAPAAAVPPPKPAGPTPIAVATGAALGANGAELTHKLAGLGLDPEQIAGVLALSREVVEKVVWEVVPTLAEALIREEIQRLTRE